MGINRKIGKENIAMIRFVADKLEELCNDVVFLGGSATALLIDDPASPDVRATLDVDCIIDVLSLKQYAQIEKQLRQKGFTQSQKDQVICRWRIGKVILDVMPTHEKILGFSNRWYKDAIENAERLFLDNTKEIRIITVPYFLATKLEAFKARGKNDYFGSHDLEDIIAVLDGRTNIVELVLTGDLQVKRYLSETFGKLMSAPSFQDALPGHLNYGSISEERIKIVWERIKQMTLPIGAC